jgi:phosphoribosylformylglycinamidine cyclo-ligase
MDYAQAGVDRDARSEAKARLSSLRSTLRFSRHGPALDTPFNTLYPIGNGVYHVKTCDGIGTKVLLAQLADKHDTMGIDAVAMVASDCIRCGARPMALTDAIDIKKSDSRILAELQEGLRAGAEQAECPLVGGETADVGELMAAQYHINCDCVGEVTRDKVIDGSKVKPGDAVVGLRSSGVHSNGISLLRRVLFKAWGGRFDEHEIPDGFERELIYEALEPTKIYVKDFFSVANDFELLGAVNVTGDAFMKFSKLTRYGFEFTNFRPQPIFGLIQATGEIADAEMLKTFNMGWGFGLVVRKEDADSVLQRISGAEVIGAVTESTGISAEYNGKIGRAHV